MLFMNCPELPRAVQLQLQPELTQNCSFTVSTRPETTQTFQPKETLKKPEDYCSPNCSFIFWMHLLSNSKFYGCIPVASLAQVRLVRPNLSIFRQRFSNLSIFDFCMQKGKLRGILGCKKWK